MAYKTFAIPDYHGTAVDLVLCNVADPDGDGLLHYAYAVAAEKEVRTRRSFPWRYAQDFSSDDYRLSHPDAISRLTEGRAYWPGEGVLGRSSPSDSDSDTSLNTIMRLGALELLANISSGRLATNEKDPFPHQLALQQYVKGLLRDDAFRRVLIADEVGLGKTIEVGLILRDILLARGKLDGFRCLYLTRGGLIDDAADKLRDVLSGGIDGEDIVMPISSFRQYGAGPTSGVRVASMDAARLYVSEKKKRQLPEGIRPGIVIIDECHHAAADDLGMTQTYRAAKQLLSGEYWIDSAPPQLAFLMSATPFRSHSQFVNLLRLLAHGVWPVP